MANELNIQNGVIVSGSVAFANLSLQSKPHALAYDTASGQVYYLQTSSIGGGGGGSTTNNYYNYYSLSSSIATGSVTASVNVGTTSFQIVSGSTGTKLITILGDQKVGLGNTDNPKFDLHLGPVENNKTGSTIFLPIQAANTVSSTGLLLGGVYVSASLSASRLYSIIGTVGDSTAIGSGLIGASHGDIVMSPRNTNSSFGIKFVYTGSVSGVADVRVRQSFTHDATWISGSLLLPSIASNNQSNVVVVSSTGQLYYTASSGLSVGTANTASYVAASNVAGLSLNRITSGSVTASVNVTTTTAFQINSGSNTILNISNTGNATLIGSGSDAPIFLVSGSQGDLFSVSDNVSGSLFSVNDSSGLPILDVISDGYVNIGSYAAPCLHTTYTTVIGSNLTQSIYSVSTSSYDAYYIDYVFKETSFSKTFSGKYTSTWSASKATGGFDSQIYLPSVGSVPSWPNFSSSVEGGLFKVYVMTPVDPTTNWVLKTIIRAI